MLASYLICMLDSDSDTYLSHIIQPVSRTEATDVHIVGQLSDLDDNLFLVTLYVFLSSDLKYRAVEALSAVLKISQPDVVEHYHSGGS